VIAVFTKYDQFRRDIGIMLEDENRDLALLNDEVERMFGEHYLANLKGSPPFVRLEGEDFVNQPTCTILISAMQECTCMANAVLILLK
jgi:hypothetical protein